MEKYEMTFSIRDPKGRVMRSKEIVTANTSFEARRILEARYPDCKIQVTKTTHLKP